MFILRRESSHDPERASESLPKLKEYAARRVSDVETTCYIYDAQDNEATRVVSTRVWGKWSDEGEKTQPSEPHPS